MSGARAVGRPFVVNSTNTITPLPNPEVTGLLGGGFVALWTQYNPETHTHTAYLQMFDDVGAKSGVESSPASGVDEYITGLAARADGGFEIYGSRVVQGSGFKTDIHIFDAQGHATSTFTIASPTGADWSLKLSESSSDHFAGIWVDTTNGTINTQIFDSSGSASGPAHQVSSTSHGYDERLYAHTLASGEFLIGWSSPSDNLGVTFQRFALDGGLLGSPFAVADPGADHQVEFDVESLTGGGFAIAWNELAPGAQNQFSELWVRIYDSAGVGGDAFTVGNELASPALAALPDGGFVVTATGVFAPNASTRPESWTFDAFGHASGSPAALIPHGATSAQGTVVTEMTGGDFVVAWGAEGAFPNTNVFAQLYTEMGESRAYEGTYRGDNFAATPGFDWTIDGRNGNDILTGGDGNDTIRGGAGSDILYGGAGHDLFEVDTDMAGRDSYSGGTGFDEIVLTGDHAFQFTAMTGIEAIRADRGVPRIVGTDHADRLDFSLVDLIDDEGRQQGVVQGGAGNDIILGSRGGDAISGGQGIDTLTGNGSTDYFTGTMFQLNGDTITDLTSDDFILVSGLDDTSGVVLGFDNGVLSIDPDGAGRRQSIAIHLTGSFEPDGFHAEDFGSDTLVFYAPDSGERAFEDIAATFLGAPDLDTSLMSIA